MYQSITVVGNLGRDPEMRYLPDGTPVTNFSVATNRRWGSGDDAKEEVVWFSVSVFRAAAEACNNYLKKGSQVLVVGRLRAGDNGGPRTFTRQDGTVGASFEITADTVRFLSGGGDASPASPAGGKHSNPNDEEDEIPF